MGSHMRALPACAYVRHEPDGLPHAVETVMGVRIDVDLHRRSVCACPLHDQFTGLCRRPVIGGPGLYQQGARRPPRSRVSGTATGRSRRPRLESGASGVATGRLSPTAQCERHAAAVRPALEKNPSRIDFGKAGQVRQPCVGIANPCRRSHRILLAFWVQFLLSPGASGARPVPAPPNPDRTQCSAQKRYDSVGIRSRGSRCEGILHSRGGAAWRGAGGVGTGRPTIRHPNLNRPSTPRSERVAASHCCPVTAQGGLRGRGCASWPREHVPRSGTHTRIESEQRTGCSTVKLLSTHCDGDVAGLFLRQHASTVAETTKSAPNDGPAHMPASTPAMSKSHRNPLTDPRPRRVLSSQKRRPSRSPKFFRCVFSASGSLAPTFLNNSSWDASSLFHVERSIRMTPARNAVRLKSSPCQFRSS